MGLSECRANYSRNSLRDRIKRSPRWDNDEGVAATIGTIMALLVFLTFMGMFTNQFVPVWMSDNESTHMANAMQQMSTLKSQIDGLIVDYSNSLLAPTTIFVPVTLHAQGIPIFAEPTAGILKFVPDNTPISPAMEITYTDRNDFTISSANDGMCGGFVDLYSPNRYFVEQHLSYEFGALILNQSDGEVVIAGPQMSVSNISGALVVKMTQISLVGLNKTVGGVGTKSVHAEMLYAETTEYGNTDESENSLTISILTTHATAWISYFNRSLGPAGADLAYGASADYAISKVLTYDNEGRLNDYYTITIVINNVQSLAHTHTAIQVSIGEVAL